MDKIHRERHGSVQPPLVSLEDRRDLLLEELRDLLRRSADEGLGVHEAVDPVVDGREVLALLDPLDEVVVLALGLDYVPGLVTEHPNLLVALLPVAPGLHHLHDEFLRGHEGKLLGDEPLDHLGINDKALGDEFTQVTVVVLLCAPVPSVAMASLLGLLSRSLILTMRSSPTVLTSVWALVSLGPSY